MQISHIPADFTPEADALAGKTILVTGAGDGIGRAAALSYASHGATVILLGRTVEKLEAVYDEIQAVGAPQPAIFPLDLAKAGDDQGRACAEAVMNDFPHLDGLLHNASILGERRPIESATFAAWQEVMQVNINAHFLLTRHLLPLLQAAPAGSIVFTSSMPIAREIAETYVRDHVKAPWYIDLLNINLNNNSLDTAKERICLYMKVRLV